MNFFISCLLIITLTACNSVSKVPVEHAAVLKNDLNTIRKALSNGYDINYDHPNYSTLLYQAVLKNKPEITRYLIENGANAHQISEAGSSLLLDAAVRANVDVVRILLQNNVDPNKENFYGITPLLAAVDTEGEELLNRLKEGEGTRHRNNKIKIARLLLDHSANPDAVSYTSETPLHIAVKNNVPELIIILKEAGADPGIRDKYGKTPQDWQKEITGSVSLRHDPHLKQKTDFNQVPQKVL